MKHTFRKLTALASAAITLLSVVSIPASAYEVTSSNYKQLKNYYHGAGASYCWSTAEQQQGMPVFTSSFLNPRSKVTVKCDFGPTQMLGTLDTSIISRSRLQNTQTALRARQAIDKISVRGVYDRLYGLKLEFQEQRNLNEFGLRVMHSSDLNFYLSQYMYLDEDSFDYNTRTATYTGRLYFDDLYIAGMRVSCNDGYTTFSEPVLTWEDGWPTVYVDFSGRLPDPNCPVFEGVYDRIMTQNQFDFYFGFYRPNGGRLQAYENSYYNLLTGLTVTYNYDGTGRYQTDQLSFGYYLPEPVGC